MCPDNRCVRFRHVYLTNDHKPNNPTGEKLLTNVLKHPVSRIYTDVHRLVYRAYRWACNCKMMAEEKSYDWDSYRLQVLHRFTLTIAVIGEISGHNRLRS
jgi:hypothetical protein